MAEEDSKPKGETEAQGPPPTGITQSETEAAFTGPAVYSNRVFLTMTPHVGRLTFVEMRAGSDIPNYRAAIVLGHTELVALRNLLNKMLPDEKIETIALKTVPDGDEK